MSERPLGDRFQENLRSLGLGRAPAHLLVAVSGGCDSMVLLHLLRGVAGPLRLTLRVAHLDHAMRPGSEADARWVAGVCTAWELPLSCARLRRAPVGELQARRARYAFLRRAARRAGADLIVTAHHADDQAETVLFRAVRGSGLTGLAGIRPRTRGGLLRPLLPFWRAELEAYAREHHLRWREDPTNRELEAARNRIRRGVLPELERHVAPGARRNLVRLAELAREEEAAWRRLVRPALRAAARREEGAVVLARPRLRDYDSAIATRVLRTVLRRFGIVLGRTGTRTALQFITDAPSGRELQLPRGVRLRVEFDEARLERAAPVPPDEPLALDRPHVGHPREGRARIGGRRYRVTCWVGDPDRQPDAPPRWRADLDLDALRFPLSLRGWRPGDRIRTAGGTKPLKKLFVEQRIPRSSRARLPVLVDADGTLLWVAGCDRPPALAARRGGETFSLVILND